MILCAFLLAAATATPPTTAPQPVRNPFWPIGHVGTREVITADLAGRKALEVRPAPKAPPPKPKSRAVTTSVKKPEPPPPPAKATNEEWLAAYRKIQIGGRFAVKGPDGKIQRKITLDGRLYADGDLKSVTSDGRRFTWRVTGLAEGKARLEPENERRLDQK